MPAQQSGSPTTYLVDGKQYIVVAKRSGGRRLLTGDRRDSQTNGDDGARLSAAKRGRLPHVRGDRLFSKVIMARLGVG
jgi:hypothetical protein